MKLLNPGLQVGCTPDSVLIYPEGQVRMDLQRTRSGAGEMFARRSVRKISFSLYFVFPGGFNLVFVVQENSLCDRFTWFNWRIGRDATSSNRHRRTRRTASEAGGDMDLVARAVRIRVGLVYVLRKFPFGGKSAQ